MARSTKEMQRDVAESEFVEDSQREKGERREAPVEVLEFWPPAEVVVAPFCAPVVGPPAVIGPPIVGPNVTPSGQDGRPELQLTNSGMHLSALKRRSQLLGVRFGK
jgi:hypothetical protein